ncbi:MAG: hypothetical protein GF311_28025 [Candidatus Lokiarchaeota archaeon]|nr:hypothetical protein [Candidatus Lokiarchaeota archaeon]MBD3243057.1 hypothetical protein [Chitinivibrionales bacterium]
MSTFESDTLDLYEAIDAFVQRGVDAPRDDEEFGALALRCFEMQFKYNEPYGHYCRLRGITPEAISQWEEIPPMPAIGFKELELRCFPVEEVVRVFRTGGTSGAGKRGQVFLNEKGLSYVKTAHEWVCKEYLMPDCDSMDLLLMVPPPHVIPDILMAFGVVVTARYIGSRENEFFIGKDGLRVDALIDCLRKAESAGQPIALIGPTQVAYGRLYETLTERGIRFSLAEGSRVFDAGGMKSGGLRLMSREEYLQRTEELLGIPSHFAVNVLGMTEVTSIFFDNTIRNYHHGKQRPRCKAHYPWTRTMAIDPETHARLPTGMVSQLVHYDLMNLGTVVAVRTDDFGYEQDGGFEIVGRALGATPKGCALSMHELVTTAEGARDG